MNSETRPVARGVTSTGAPLDLNLTKCHSLVPCHTQGVYLITYADINDYGTNLKGAGLVTYGACAGHINAMRLGCGDLIYVSDRAIVTE